MLIYGGAKLETSSFESKTNLSLREVCAVVLIMAIVLPSVVVLSMFVGGGNVQNK